MKPCGIITTIMDLRKVKEWWFNIPLLVFHLVFLIVGTVYGKIKWPKWRYRWADATIDFSAYMVFLLLLFALPKWGSIPIAVIFAFVLVAMFRGLPWRRVWQAAQVSHVRLCLQRIDPKWVGMELKKFKYHYEDTMVCKFSEVTWQYINFGYPKAELQYWCMDQCDGKRFKYYDPTFEPSPEFIERMVGYAEKLVKNPVARKYDWLQLILGYPANLIVWIFCLWKWGKEVIRWFNLPGSKEVCSSGWVACLRWGDRDFWDEYTREVGRTFGVKSLKDNRRFFPGYSTAVIPPCLAPLSKNWRECG